MVFTGFDVVFFLKSFVTVCRPCDTFTNKTPLYTSGYHRSIPYESSATKSPSVSTIHVSTLFHFNVSHNPHNIDWSFLSLNKEKESAFSSSLFFVLYIRFVHNTWDRSLYQVSNANTYKMLFSVLNIANVKLHE